MRLPDFYLAGAQKCGTTTLHRLLASHAELYAPEKPQEIHFFDMEENHERGLDWFASLFADASPEQQVFQTSPLYLYEEAVAGRIAEATPEARLIFILREPVARAYSHYWHEIRYGREHLPFEEALACERERLGGGFAARRVFSYADRGRYATQLERFLDRFPAERILVLRHDDLASRPAWVAERCGSFLGVDPGGFSLPEKRHNRARQARSPRVQRWTAPLRRRTPRLVWLVDQLNLRRASYPPMRAETRTRLAVGLASEIERLGALTGLDVAPWLERGGVE